MIPSCHLLCDYYVMSLLRLFQSSPLNWICFGCFTDFTFDLISATGRMVLGFHVCLSRTTSWAIDCVLPFLEIFLGQRDGVWCSWLALRRHSCHSLFSVQSDIDWHSDSFPVGIWFCWHTLHFQHFVGASSFPLRDSLRKMCSHNSFIGANPGLISHCAGSEPDPPAPCCRERCCRPGFILEPFV